MNRIMIGAGLLASITLTGCFSDSGSQDKGSTPQVQVSGLAVDGYVAGAWVYADLDNNGTRDGFEPRALTDAFGFYSYRPQIQLGDVIVPERDYCRDGPARHCLRIAATSSEVMLRVEGGYDLMTGLPFPGGMSRQIAVPLSDSTEVLAITPLTTVAGSVVAGRGDYWGDYFAEDVLDPVDAVLAYQIHQLLSRVAYELFGDGALSEDILLVPLTGELYRQLADDIEASDLLSVWLEYDENDFRNLIIRALTALGLYDPTDAVQAAQIDALAAAAADVQAAISVALQAEADKAGSPMLRSTSSAGDSFLNGILVAMPLAPPSPISFDILGPLLEQFRQYLEGEDDVPETAAELRSLDLRRLIERIQEEFDAQGNLDALGALDQFLINAELPEIGGTQIRIDDEDSDAWAGLYFFGEPGDIEGAMRLCVSSDGVIDLSDFGDGDVISINGIWAKPTPTQLVLTLSAFGESFLDTASLQLGVGTGSVGDDYVWSFIFDYDGESDRYVATTSTNQFDLLVPTSPNDVVCDE
jgi:hypothetical protein